MDQLEDPRDLERKIEQASRIASRVTDQTTYQRLTAWVEELRQRLQKHVAARRSKEAIRTRAHELWEQHGRPSGRDEEFWLQAEAELREHRE
jgi:predicted RNA-binding Zn ribbon-like protein